MVVELRHLKLDINMGIYLQGGYSGRKDNHQRTDGNIPHEK